MMTIVKIRGLSGLIKPAIFEVLSAAQIFKSLGMIPCGLVCRYKRFEKACCLHLYKSVWRNVAGDSNVLIIPTSRPCSL